MSYKFWIGLRYLFAKRQEKFISLVSLIAVFGIAIGVMALIIVLGVMSGFDEDLKDKILGANPHLVIDTMGEPVDADAIKKTLDGIDGVEATACFIEGQALLQRGGYVQGLVLRGLDTADTSRVTRLDDYITQGSVSSLKDDEVILGVELMKKFGLFVGDEVELISPFGGKEHPMRVAGTFKTGMYEYDVNLAFSNLDFAQKFFRIPSKATGIGVKLCDPYKAPQVKDKIDTMMPFSVRSWMDINRNLFEALKLEKTVMFIIVALVVLVGCFNVVSTLVMMTMEKTKDIGILKAIGVTNNGIASIFIFNGLMMGIFGTALGALSGLGICGLLEKYPIIKLPSDVYYMDKLPVMVEIPDVMLIVAASLTIAFFAALYPAMRAARFNPVESLRYE